jgi:predicted transcriptional regulator
MGLSRTLSQHREGLNKSHSNSSKLSCDFPKRTYALLSIRPNFASAILNGEKRFEFRRRKFAQSVKVVLVYATIPVRQVVAEFEVRSVISGGLDSLWRRTRNFAGIEKKVFLAYFKGVQIGHAIEIGKVKRYKEPYCPIKKLGIRPPQSFVYVTGARSMSVN